MKVNTTKIMLADDNAKFKEELKNSIERDEALEFTEYFPEDGDIIERIKEEKPDVLIMDLVLPYRPGMEILSDLYNLKMKKPPIIIVASALTDDKSIRESIMYGANYFIAKPCAPNNILNIIKKLMGDKKEKEIFDIKNEKIEDNSYSTNNLTEILESKVTAIIHKVGIPAHIKGYQYIRTAIIKSIIDTDIINSVTKELYPQVAKAHDTTPPRVERAIRHAIEIAWTRGDTETLEKIFGYTVQSNKGKPTNSEFIAMISDRLRLQNQSILG